ncbi:MAG TPA: hypothetical protein VGX03_33925 [Candidatus Binatia bacterium]|nr:hypothetical protein [Candidatus Binatia bacterium]
MSDTSARSRLTPALLAVSVSLLALTAGSVSARAETSEIDRFQMAVASQTEQDALAFIKAFPSSHLIGDLFDLLPPEIAQQVCTVLADSAPARAQSACNTLQRAYAVAPIEPAAGPTPVDAQLTDAQAPATQGISISALPTDDPASSPVIVRRGGKGDDNTPYWLIPARPNSAHGAGDGSGADGSASGGSSSNANGAGTSGSPSNSGSADGTGSSASSSGNGGSPSNSSSGGTSPGTNSSGGGGSPSASGSGPSGSSPGQGGGVLGNAGDAVGGAAAAVGGAVGDAGNAVGGAVGSAGGPAGGAVGAVGHAADSAVGAVGNVAGGLLGD